MAEGKRRNERRWFEGYSSRKAVEAFSPGVHCTFAELQQDRTSEPRRLPKDALRSKNGRWNYKCVTDAARLNDQTLRYEFPVTNLRHVTIRGNAKKICRTNVFQGSPNKNRGRCKEAQYYNKEYVWWSAYYEQGSDPQVKAQETATAVQGKMNQNTHANPVQTSDPFQEKLEKILYGKESEEKKAFRYPWEEIINAYKKQFCSDLDSRLRFRILGTYVYRQEIMQAIVVHSSENDGIFQDLPLIENGFNGSRVQMDDEGLMTWCPESVIRINVNPWSPWEHLSFAFHVPNRETFQLEDLRGHLEEIDRVNLPPEDKKVQAGKSEESATPVQQQQVDQVEDSEQSATSEDEVVPGFSKLSLNSTKE